MRKNISTAAILILLLASSLRAEKVVEIPLTKSEWRELEKTIPGAYFTRPTDKGIAILIEDESLKNLEDLGIRYVILEDLTEEKRLYYTGKSQYHTYSQMSADLSQLAQNYSTIAKLDTIGYSIQGRPILCLKISDNPTINEPEPKVRFVGAHHGNEWISAEVPFLYAKYLLENYSSNQSVQSLVNSREIYIVPIVNPDGHVSQTRYNANGVDLNRNYGYIQNNSGSGPFSEPETRAIHEYSKTRSFNMSLSFHSGAVYVNYLWNYTPVRCADDRYNNLVYYYSQQYGSITGYPITEGYEWYQTLGDLNDYSYGINGDIDWTIEVSNSYIPDPSQIDPIFNANRPAMDLFARKMGQGIGGFVFDSLTGDTIKIARVTIYPVNWPVWADRNTGDFIRPLLPGTYSIKVEAPGYAPKTISGVTVQTDTLTWVNVFLTPRQDKRISLYKPEIIYINAQNAVITGDTFQTHYALGDPDGLFYSLGVSGYAVFDLGAELKAESIYVYEGNDGTPNEGFDIYVSNSPYGTWTHVGGRAYGNAIIPSNNTFRYIKIVDDGDGSSSVRKCGYDLDAIVVKVKPAIELVRYTVNELSGNGNGIVNPGEDGVLAFLIKNSSPAGISVLSVVPQCTDPFIQFNEDSVIIYSMNPGQEVLDSLIFLTSENLPFDYSANMNLEIHAEGYTINFPLTLLLNQKDSTVYTGPDGFGYYAYDSMDSLYSEFEPFSFRDISSSGTIISQITNSDDATTQLSLPFTFKYYGLNYNNLSVCSNGWIALGTTTSNTCNNRPIPDPSNPPALIAPFFADLDPSSSGDVYYYYDVSSHEFIIMWKNVRLWGSGTSATFEVLLRDPSYYSTLTGDGEIVFIYGSMPQNATATVGIESPNHGTGIQCYYNGTYDPSISTIRSGQFIKFTTDPPSGTPVAETHAPAVRIQTSMVTNSFSFETANISTGKLLIFDASGRLITSRHFVASKEPQTVPLKSLPAGVYFAVIAAPERGYYRTFKFVKIE